MTEGVAASAFDAVVDEVTMALAVPVAFIGMAGEDGESLAAIRGWNVSTIPADRSFASRITTQRDVVVVPDATSDPRFNTHPLVVGVPYVRFVASAPIFDADGGFAGALTVLDRAPRTLSAEGVALLRTSAAQVTRELIARRRIEETESRFRDFFERTDDLVMSLGPDGRLLHANGAVATALGVSREELMRTPLPRFVDPNERQELERVLAEVFQVGEPRRIETVFVTSSGRRITVDGSLHPKLIDDAVVLARVVFRDVSDRKQFETELGNARDAALEAARLKTQFLTNVSHEIRTPMNGIVGMIDLLLATPLSQEQSDFAHQARASAEQLLSVVTNILYVSNMEAGGLSAASVDFDLLRTLQRIVEVIKIAALGKDLNITLLYDERLPTVLRGNPGKLRQVLSNLLENAVKFTEEGSVVVNVELKKETDSHHLVRFEVRDSGIGIDDEHRLLLFERFSQIEATSTRRFQGVGLGLATARQLVETMGGLIDVESTPGVGSTFWFSIPFPKDSAARGLHRTADLAFAGKRVLLIDGSPTSQRIVHHYLQTTWGMRVDVADDAAGALRMLREAAVRDPYRVVLFDRVTDREPLAFARAIRGDATLSGASLIALLSTSNGLNEQQMRDAGIRSYVLKPVGQSELFDALTVALAHVAVSAALPEVELLSYNEPVPLPSAEQRASIRVLLAEDNFLNMKLTMSQLQKLGYTAESVANGKEAVEALAKGDYAIVLMDCQMPIMDGYEATMAIRKRQERGARRPRIIAMTANALDGDREKCLAAGMDDYLAKPTKADELEQALARYFAGR